MLNRGKGRAVAQRDFDRLKEQADKIHIKSNRITPCNSTGRELTG